MGGKRGTRESKKTTQEPGETEQPPQKEILHKRNQGNQRNPQDQEDVRELAEPGVQEEHILLFSI